MHFVLESGRHEVRLTVSVRDNFVHDIAVLQFMQQMAKQNQYAASVRGLKLLFQRYSASGRNGLTAESFHEVDKKHEIWEFVKGDLRIFCFRDASHIVLTHGCIKKTQKVDAAQITTAVAAKTAYFGD